jgi:hypothetical protein
MFRDLPRRHRRADPDKRAEVAIVDAGFLEDGIVSLIPPASLFAAP